MLNLDILGKAVRSIQLVYEKHNNTNIRKQTDRQTRGRTRCSYHVTDSRGVAAELGVLADAHYCWSLILLLIVSHASPPLPVSALTLHYHAFDQQLFHHHHLISKNIEEHKSKYIETNLKISLYEGKLIVNYLVSEYSNCVVSFQFLLTIANIKTKFNRT